MGAAQIPLDVVTVMVASVNLGIIDDETIHVCFDIAAMAVVRIAGQADAA